MSDKRRPPSLHHGPAPVAEPPEPGYVGVVFYFDHGGDVSATIPESSLASLQGFTEQAWGGVGGQTYTLTDGSGRPSLLINLGKVRLVSVQ